ncbi:MAG TPA: RagB/SusD family nutrient uptake outer membrane protein [Cytophagaceae bacterium]
MKNILYINILISFLLVLTSCKKFLEVEPKNAVLDEVTIYDKASAETALRGAYRQLGHTNYYGQNYVTLAIFPGGDVVNNTTGGGQNMVDLNFRSDDPLFSASWEAIYNAINRANHILQKVPGISDPALTAELKNQILGEAYFIRALSYFDLARGWGGVQIKLTPTADLTNNDSGIPRSTFEQTLDQVLSDLDKAEDLLPNTVNRVRATKKTVWALKARLYLYKKDWPNAELYATKVIDDGNFKLEKPFNSWFANNRVATEESIFEIAFSAQNPNTIRDYLQHPTKGGTYRFTANNNFINLLKDPSIGGGPNGRRSLVDSLTQNNTTLWYINLYYRSPATDPAYVLRIAEMYLIRAEARAEQTNFDQAIDDINIIRDRANLSDLDADIDTKEEILLAIENERRFEFAFEAHRYFDLARTGRLRAVIEGADPKKKVDAHEYVFPIPVSQVQLDNSLKQTPGY